MVRALLVALAALLLAATPAAADETLLGWRIDQAGRDPQSLDLIAYGSGCGFGDGGPQIEETAREIRVRMVSDVPDDTLCTMIYKPYPVTVRLAGPIGGRPIVGPRRLRDEPGDAGAGGPKKVPRVLGLSPRDARDVVVLHGFRPVVERTADLRTRPRTIGQTPRSGGTRAAGAVVTLFVSR